MTSEETTHVQIPGTMSARVINGNIIGFDFSPAAAYAGYFGEDINVTEGPEITAEDFWSMVANKLTHDYQMQSSTMTCHWTC